MFHHLLIGAVAAAVGFAGAGVIVGVYEVMFRLELSFVQAAAVWFVVCTVVYATISLICKRLPSKES